MNRQGAHRRGLTLLELVIVLVVLTILGTVTISQTTGLANQARFDRTTRTLASLRDAVLGRDAVTGDDPTALALGFVAEVGRLPRAGEGLDLAELWDRNASALPPDEYAVQTLTGLDDELRFGCGWRGPYVRLPVGTDDLRDGWTRPFDLLHRDGTTVDDPTDAVAAIQSAGSGVGDSFDVLLDDVVFVDELVGIDLTTGEPALQVQFTLPESPSAGSYVVVRLYGPVNGLAVVVAQSRAYPGTVGKTQTIPIEFSPSAVPIGPKLLRAYQWNSSVAPTVTDDLTARVKSESRRVTVLAGGVMWPDLDLEGE